ncbi:serine hydrolase domain-containing protein [Paenibacillus sp. YPG26]|uniref:serine hydrolase domain-containing protein n=1 Tax=Paenibacillus sp. YPG26 TaxID=2878915 RepID=UPI0020403F82|nr:serine hydrolase domain-containing protein [Paenibacillus sp. YPG26]USB33122.1 beta-lactamase family protein [Paenibacillus sp. YPG26]
MFIKLKFASWLLLAALLCSVVPASVSASAPDKPELEAFLDEFMNSKMKQYPVPGAVVSVVQGGQTVLMKGYGYANLEQKMAADPHKTIFRVGSISKSVTSTAVMQLVEEGKIDLHKDIKQYAPDLKLSYIDHSPITMHHLLTHTAGFCESIYAVGRDKDQQIPLEEAVKAGLPGLCRKPGEQIAYSNQGMSLAGYLVQKIEGKPFEEVIRDRLFKPLQMNHSSFHFEESDPNLAKSYSYENGNYKAAPYSYIHYLPSGALNSTAEDMTHFMIAHLQEGQYEGSRILSNKAAKLMHETQFTPNKSMPGMAYGFYERNQNGLRLIEHDGGIDGFESYMYLLPSERTGIFISTNSGEGINIIEQLIGAYLDRFYPDSHKVTQAANPTTVQELKSVEGYYVPNRAHLRGPFNFAQNLSAVHVKAVEDGVITMKDQRYLQIEPNLFRNESSQELIYVDREQHTLALSSIPTMIYERQNSPIYHPALNIGILLGLALIYPLQVIVALILGLIGLVRRKRVRIDWFSTLVSVLFIVYFLFVISTQELFVHRIPQWSFLLIYLPVFLVSVLIVRLLTSLVRKRRVTVLQYLFLAATAAFVIYLYSWSFFSI